MPRLVLIGLVGLLLLLQYALWFGDHGALDLRRLHQVLEAGETDIDELRRRNQTLQADVIDLKTGVAAVEERARSELGMIKAGEVFYQVVE